jgi:hypothetical protein
MAEVKIGSVLKDNDKRDGGRTVTVVSIVWCSWPKDHLYVCYKKGRRVCKIRLDRIHTDGKPHSNGWSLVTEPVAG